MFLCGWTCQCMGEPGEPDCACTVWRILPAFLGGHPIKRARQMNQPTVMNHHTSIVSGKYGLIPVPSSPGYMLLIIYHND
jgi:hypothetical protein